MSHFRPMRRHTALAMYYTVSFLHFQRAYMQITSPYVLLHGSNEPQKKCYFLLSLRYFFCKSVSTDIIQGLVIK